MDPIRIHATCIRIGTHGVLLRGASASGKSDLALRLIDGGAALVADDQTELTAAGGVLTARPPQALAGLMEVRGLGILRVGNAESAQVRLVIDLVPPEACERMPKPGRCELCGVSLPLVALAPFEASAPAKVRLAVRLATGDIITAHG